MSASDIARRFNTSDTHALGIFDHYVNMKRLPLSEAVSVDEVHLDIDDNSKYVLVIQNFATGEPIDLLPSRKHNVTEPYFSNLPKEERFAVKYLISHMNNEFIRYVDRYFPNAVSVVDSFHVIQWINAELDSYVRTLQRSILARDSELQKEKSLEAGHQVRLPMSDEYYLLKHYRFFLLSNPDTITYHDEPHMDKHFRYLMRTSDYEERFFNVHPDLAELRDLRHST